jgi:L-gulonate 3-dehydrogenase
MTGSVAIVGVGLIGRAWAMIFARAGWNVRLFDAAAGVAEAAIPLCADGLHVLAGNGLCAEPEVAGHRIRTFATLASCLDGVSFVQENGPETPSWPRPPRRSGAPCSPRICRAGRAA